jgi:hypothetical protein
VVIQGVLPRHAPNRHLADRAVGAETTRIASSFRTSAISVATALWYARGRAVPIEEVPPYSILIFDFLRGSADSALQVRAGHSLVSAIDTLAAKRGGLISPLTHGDVTLGRIYSGLLGGRRSRRRAWRRAGASGCERKGERANRDSKYGRARITHRGTHCPFARVRSCSSWRR